MKIFIYLALILILGSFGYNLWAMDYTKSFMSEVNRPYIFGLSAGVCATVVCVILLKYEHLKQNLANQAK